jgi:hypothetical protein
MLVGLRSYQFLGGFSRLANPGNILLSRDDEEGIRSFARSLGLAVPHSELIPSSSLYGYRYPPLQHIPFGSSRYYRDLRATIMRHRRVDMCMPSWDNLMYQRGAGNLASLRCWICRRLHHHCPTLSIPRENDNKNTQERERRDAG